MRGEEMEELVALAEERDLTLMPGHLLLYHPARAEVKELVDAGDARRRALRLRQPPEPRIIRRRVTTGPVLAWKILSCYTSLTRRDIRVME
jgi:predicted dehydrogenase